MLMLLVACAEGWSVDGGWGGRSVCEDDTVLQVEAIFDGDTDAGTVDGLFVLDLPIDLGLLGAITTVQRGTIQDGRLTDGSVVVLEGDIVRDPAYTNGETRNYRFTAEVVPGELSMQGTLDQVNNDGASLRACDLELDRMHD